MAFQPISVSTCASDALRLPPRQQYTTGAQSRGFAAQCVSRMRPILRATSAAPSLRAANADSCECSVPTTLRSSSLSTGRFTAPGK
jgi:hypothetical protein